MIDPDDDTRTAAQRLGMVEEPLDPTCVQCGRRFAGASRFELLPPAAGYVCLLCLVELSRAAPVRVRQTNPDGVSVEMVYTCPEPLPSAFVGDKAVDIASKAFRPGTTTYNSVTVHCPRCGLQLKEGGCSVSFDSDSQRTIVRCRTWL